MQIQLCAKVSSTQPREETAIKFPYYILKDFAFSENHLFPFYMHGHGQVWTSKIESLGSVLSVIFIPKL